MKLRITVEGKTYEVEVEVVEEGLAAPLHGSTWGHGSSVAELASTAQPHAPAAGVPTPSPGVSSDRVVKAPIVGTILQIKVAPGDTVSINQVLLVMEAMKMETNVASPLAGKVKAVRVSPGEAVKAGQVLVELE